MVKRPKLLITAGITEPLALLSVQQCNHQFSTYNAQVASASPGKGRGEAAGPEPPDREQMDNVSFDIVFQHMMNLGLKYSNWGFIF